MTKQTFREVCELIFIFGALVMGFVFMFKIWQQMDYAEDVRMQTMYRHQENMRASELGAFR